jgi:RND family efflux transporter MFP subunit
VVVHVFDVQPSHKEPDGDLLIPAALSVDDAAIVLAEREGRIVDVLAQEGKHVAKGDILAQLNDEDQLTQVAQAELEVTRLKVEEQQIESLVKLNRSERDRELLLAREGLSSESDVQRSEYKLDQSIHEFEKSRLATDAARTRVEAAKLELQKTVVHAPVAGSVTKRFISLGTGVAKNDKLFEVANLSKLEVRFRLPQTARDKLGISRILNLSTLNSEATIATARIRLIDPVADATSNTFGYIADVIGPAGLMPGLAVNVHVPRAEGNVSFWVPRAAFNERADLHNGGSNTLFVVAGEKALSRTVVIAGLEGDQVEVVAGLTADERIVIAPPTGLRDGDTVEVSQS